MVSDRFPPMGHPAVRDVCGHPDVSELYLAADVLVTDYSSTMLDFAVTGRPMAFLTYDPADFQNRLRGFYFDLAPEAPGPLVDTTGELIDVLRDAARARAPGLPCGHRGLMRSGDLHDPEPDLHRFYTQRYVEDDRLRMSPHGRLELARTRELLDRKLPGAPARVLDVGGGTGVHARWLVEHGYEVHLVDIVPEHVEQAARIAGVSASVGDARELEQPDDWADVVLVLGPL